MNERKKTISNVPFVCLAFSKYLEGLNKDIYIYINSPGSTPSNSFLLRVGLEPGIPAREAGALTRNAKGYSL